MESKRGEETDKRDKTGTATTEYQPNFSSEEFIKRKVSNLPFSQQIMQLGRSLLTYLHFFMDNI